MKMNVGDIITLSRGRLVSVGKDLTAADEYIHAADAQLVIKNAVVVEGEEAFKTDIVITDGRISALGKVGEHTCRQIDAEGLAVTAGSIQTISSADTYALEDLLFSGTSTVVYDGCPDPNDIKLMLDHPLNFCFPYYQEKRSASTVSCLSDHVGKVSVGMIADLYLWRPERINKSPEKIIKCGRCIYDRVLSDRRDVIYLFSYNTSCVPARSASVVFTSRSDYLSELYKYDYNIIALDA